MLWYAFQFIQLFFLLSASFSFTCKPFASQDTLGTLLLKKDRAFFPYWLNTPAASLTCFQQCKTDGNQCKSCRVLQYCHLFSYISGSHMLTFPTLYIDYRMSLHFVTRILRNKCCSNVLLCLCAMQLLVKTSSLWLCLLLLASCIAYTSWVIIHREKSIYSEKALWMWGF